MGNKGEKYNVLQKIIELIEETLCRISKCEINKFFDIILTVDHDKLYDKTNEMNFLKFYSVNILYK